MIKPSLHLKNIFKKTFLLLLLLLISAAALFYWSLVRAVPDKSGHYKIERLSDQVKVVHDTFGIPHIEAKNSVDAFRVLGHLIASERLFQMETQRRMAYGELSEIFGRKTLMMDRTFRTLGLKKLSQKILNEKMASGQMDPQMLKEVEAFFDGINQFQEKGPLPLEFHLLGIRPEPFTLVDAHAFIGVMSYSFAMAMFQDVLMSHLANRLESDKLEELRTGHGEEKASAKAYVQQIHNQPDIKIVTDIFGEMQRGFPFFEGSNGWLLSGKKSKSGFPILANDPHIAFSHPGIWYEAHIKTPEYESYGHYLSILPYPVQVHTRKMAWGFTMTLTDDMDLYREKIDWEKKQYEYKKELFPLAVSEEKIQIRGHDPEILNVFSTRHGPVMDHAIAEKNLALKWSFLDDFSQSKDLISLLFKMGRSKSMQEFKEIIKDGKAPGLNILYADQENIAWWMFGDAVIRPDGVKSDFILDGASGRDEPLGLIPFEQKPHLENPADGIIVSANNRPSSYPKNQRGDFQPSDRYSTIRQILEQKDKWDLEELKAIQTLNMNFENKAVLSQLLAATKYNSYWKKKGYENFLHTLESWDLQSKKETLAPLLYYSWLGHIKRLVLKDLNEEEFAVYSKISGGSAFHKKLLIDDSSSWWRNSDKEKILLQAFDQMIADLKKRLGDDQKNWSWGRLHQLEFSHPLGSIRPLNKIFNIGPVPMDGAIQEINNQRYIGLDFKIVTGPSTRRLIDMGQPEKSWGVLPAGNSGHQLSPYYKDQLDLFINGGYRPQSMNAADYESTQSHTAVFSSK